MELRRVAITGMNSISGIGNNIDEMWENLINGKSGIDNITSFDTADLPVTFAGEVKKLSHYASKPFER